MKFAPHPTLLACVTALLFSFGCATGSGATGPASRGYLRFEVEPANAEVEIDEEYNGLVEGWAQQTVPVDPGLRKVTVRAAGYMTQRFDIEVAAGEEVTLVLNLERSLDLEADEAATRSPAASRIQKAFRE